MTFLRETLEGTVVEVHVQPRSSKNELVGLHQGRLKLRLTAPPVEGEANKECIRFLSKILGISKSTIEVIQGHKSRRKSILVRGLGLESIIERLKESGIS